jgi:hypothetical protein
VAFCVWGLVVLRWCYKSKRVIDKMPHNYELLGLIAILFPNAKILHCTRDPMDTCLSCFTHNFADAHGYNADLRTLGQYYTCYSNLMDHWHDVLPGRIIDSSYEYLVGDQEVASRRIIDALDLPWDDACLSFYDTKRMVLTPSQWQVRQKMYATSIRKWENYAQHLKPLQDAIDNSSASSLHQNLGWQSSKVD